MKKSTHIAVVCNYELKPDRIGGMDRFFKAYNDELIAEGNRVSWFFSGGENFDFYADFDLHIARNTAVEDLFLEFSNSENAPDIVVTHFVALCTSFYKKLKTKGNPFVIAVDHNPRPLQGFPLKKRIKNRARGIMYSRYIDCFVGVSKYTVNCILEDYGQQLSKKTNLVYNGIDASLYKKRTQQNQGKFIVASHLRESKGIQDLIEAVHLLPEHKKKLFQIDIFGEGLLEADLKALAREYHLEKQLQFKGSSADLPRLFREYSFLLQPTYMECFSLSILESLAANVPVITTPVGGNPEIIREGGNGFLFQPGNAKQLSEVLQKVMTGDFSLEKELNREIEENFNLEKMVQNHIKLLPCT